MDEDENSGREPLSISISDTDYEDNFSNTLIPNENIFTSDSQPTGTEFLMKFH